MYDNHANLNTLEYNCKYKVKRIDLGKWLLWLQRMVLYTKKNRFMG